MKQSPDEKKLEEQLRSSIIAAGGFLGTDQRSLDEIIDSDLNDLTELGISIINVVRRMNHITNIAIPALGNWAQVDHKLEARVDEAKGSIICPWPHPAAFAKRITYVKNRQTQEIFKWTDLNIHLIEKHNFFEGKGAPYRIEPKELVKFIF